MFTIVKYIGSTKLSEKEQDKLKNFEIGKKYMVVYTEVNENITKYCIEEADELVLANAFLKCDDEYTKKRLEELKNIINDFSLSEILDEVESRVNTITEISSSDIKDIPACILREVFYDNLNALMIQ